MGVRQRLKKLLQLALGWAFLFLGVAGLFLPILQGVLFIMLGLVLLSYHMPWAERLLTRLRARFPRQHAAMHEVAGRLRQRLGGWWWRRAAAHDCDRDGRQD